MHFNGVQYTMFMRAWIQIRQFLKYLSMYLQYFRHGMFMVTTHTLSNKHIIVFYHFIAMYYILEL